MATRKTTTLPKTKPVSKKAPVVKKTTTPKAEAVTKNTLDQRVFNYPISDALLTQVIHVYRENSHQNTSKVKTRGELERTTKKVYKQKGTGNARHGSRMAPIYVGGGVAFGPTGIKPANLKLNRKMRAAGLAGVLTLLAKADRIEIVNVPDFDKPSTKSVQNLFAKKRSLLVYDKESKNFLSSASNLQNLSLISSNQLNPYTVSLHQHIIFTPSAHESLVERLLPLIKIKKQ